LLLKGLAENSSIVYEEMNDTKIYMETQSLFRINN
jgi:hypothetical protein